MTSSKNISAVFLAEFLPGVAVLPQDLHRQLRSRDLGVVTVGSERVQSVWGAGPALRELARAGLKLETIDPEALHPSAQKKLQSELRFVSMAIREYADKLATAAQKQLSADAWKKLAGRLEEAEGNEAITLLQDTLADLQTKKSTPVK